MTFKVYMLVMPLQSVGVTCLGMVQHLHTTMHVNTLQVELEIMLPEDMSVKESHDIALMLQHKVISFTRCTSHL